MNLVIQGMLIALDWTDFILVYNVMFRLQNVQGLHESCLLWVISTISQELVKS